jgi:hypothetical protein
MPQANSFRGIDLGNPGSDNTRLRIVAGEGDPNLSSTDGVSSAAIGSLYLRTDTAGLYQKTSLEPLGSAGVWTLK